jgi:hypothetical protein
MKNGKAKSSANHQNTLDLLALDISSGMQIEPKTKGNKYDFLDDLNGNPEVTYRKSLNQNGNHTQFL